MNYEAMAERLGPAMRRALLKMLGGEPTPQTLDAMTALGLVYRRRGGRNRYQITRHGAAVARRILDQDRTALELRCYAERLSEVGKTPQNKALSHAPDRENSIPA